MIHFYCFSSINTILISDRPLDKVRSKYGRQYEILNSIRDRSSIPIILNRLLRSYNGYEVIEWLVKIKPPVSDETRAKMSASKLGKPRPMESNMKTSATMKGKSNFAGKRHTEETKKKISDKLKDNDNASELIWCHHPVTGEEKRIESVDKLPPGWMIGREYYSMEPLIRAGRGLG